MKRYVQVALNKALSSDQLQRHGCVIVKGGKVRVAACNTMWRNALHGRSMPSIHAEMYALSLAFRNVQIKSSKKEKKNSGRHLRKNHLSQGDVYVVRLRPDGSIAYSRPCNECIKCMKQAGIGRVFYSLDDGTILMERVAKMEPGYVSAQQCSYNISTFPQERIHF